MESGDGKADSSQASEKAKRLQNRWQGRIFVLPSYQAEALALARADLIEKPVMAESETGSAGMEAAPAAGLPAGR